MEDTAGFKVRGIKHLKCFQNYIFLALIVLSGCQFKDLSSLQDDNANLLKFVNPLIGTQSSRELSNGNVYPAVSMPWGMNAWTPQTGKDNDPWIYTYNAKTIQGFRCTHQSSPWTGDYGSFSIMPEVGELTIQGDNRATPFYHTEEISTPYYYQVYLHKKKINVEMSPTERGSIFKFTYPESNASYIVIDALPGGGYLRIIPQQRRIIGFCKNNSGSTPKDFATYFVAEFDKEFLNYTSWNNDTIRSLTREIKGDHIGVAIRFNTYRNEEITMKVATSFISIPQAIINMDRELSKYSFDQIKLKANHAWNSELNKILVDGGTADQKQLFYTSFYRMLLYPRIFYEFDDQDEIIHYSPFDGQIRSGYMFTDHGISSGFRALYPFYTLMFPEMESQIIQGLLNTYKESGWLPAWPSPGYRDYMIGTHAASIFTDAYIKGIRNFDIDLAYQAMKKDAFVEPPRYAPGRDGLKAYNDLGFIPFPDYTEASAKTLEYSYDDFCILQMATNLNQLDDIDIFRKKAHNYTNVFDSSVNFMRGRQKDRQWLPSFDPIEWGGPFSKGNAWHYTWSVYHDVQGLIDLMGGDKKFIEKLDSVFIRPPEFKVGSYGKVINEMTEMVLTDMGQYAHGLPPTHHMTYLYNYTSQPWKCQQWVRDVMNKLYKPTPDGYCGEENNGQLSAWYLFSAMGFYPVTPGQSQYVFGSPVFQKVTLFLDNGKKFTIETSENDEQNKYIEKVELNGDRYSNNWILHEDIIKGGTLYFELDNKPNRKRGIEKSNFPYSLSNQ